MPYPELSTLLKASVGLELEPIALAFVDERPAGVPAAAEPVPSSCSFWRKAETSVFYASAADHAGCAVGAHVMGFPLAEQTTADLMADVELMAEVGYLPENEVANIPRVARSGAGIVYGPLAEYPLEPDAVLVWVTPAQAMILEEALKTTAWGDDKSDGQELFGRPACGAVARSINTQRSAFSLGCVGMRTYTRILPELSPLVIPGAALQTLVADLPGVREANDKMLDYHDAKMAAYV